MRKISIRFLRTIFSRVITGTTIVDIEKGPFVLLGQTDCPTQETSWGNAGNLWPGTSPDLDFMQRSKKFSTSFLIVKVLLDNFVILSLRWLVARHFGSSKSRIQRLFRVSQNHSFGDAESRVFHIHGRVLINHFFTNRAYLKSCSLFFP